MILEVGYDVHFFPAMMPENAGDIEKNLEFFRGDIEP